MIENKILCGKAEEVLKSFPDDLVTLTVTSPPFNVDMPYSIHNDAMAYEKYLKMLSDVFKEVYRITKKGGRLFIDLPSYLKMSKNSYVAYSTIDILHLLTQEIGWRHGDLIIWDKGTIISKRQTAWGSWCSPSSPYIRDRIDLLFVLYKEQYKLTHKGETDLIRDEFLEWTVNIWKIPPERKIRKYHTAPFPLELPYRAIKLFSFKEDVILDPFCGTGTTCVAAKMLGRKFIGIDISRNYVLLAKKRLKNSEKEVQSCSSS